jgi:phytoene desaturase
MGPSWYWMPDDVSLLILKKTTDYYELIKLSPAHRVYYGIDDFITINEDNLTEIIAACLKEALLFDAPDKSNYDIAIKDLVYRPAAIELITKKP